MVVENQSTGTVTVATFSDTTPSAAAGYTASINWGDGVTTVGIVVDDGGGNFHVTAFAGSHTYTEDGSYTITVTITETAGDNDSAAPTGTATVTESVLTMTSLTPSAVEGTSSTLHVANFSDLGSPDAGTAFTATINWGDSTTSAGALTPTGGGAFAVNGTHTYADEGAYTTNVTVFENNQPSFTVSVTGTATVTENDSLTGIGKTITTGQTFSGAVATFLDTNGSAPATDFTASINWGDGTITAGTVSGPTGGPFVVSGTHTYASPGQYTVAVTLKDDAPGTASATAVSTINAATPPVLVKSFGAATIPVGGSTTLNFFLSNPNDFATLSGVGFTDNLPAGLVISNPNGLSLSCSGGSGAAVQAVAGGTTITVSNGTLAPSGACSISVSVTGTSLGPKVNTTSTVSSNGGTGAPATASITVVPALAAARIQKGFGVPAATLNHPVKLTFRITNPNTSALTGVGFTDVMPLGLLIATPNRLTGSCGGGTITAPAGDNTITLTGATLPASSTCTFYVYIIGNSFGWKHNITSRVTADNAPPGNQAVATILI
jgi:PKD repeat protein